MLSFLILTLYLFNFYKFPINGIAVVDAKKKSMFRENSFHATLLFPCTLSLSCKYLL